MSDADLWVSGNPPWGTVRAVVRRESYAVVFDDLNSDFREIVATLLRHGPDGWQELVYHDDAAMPGHEEATFSGGVGDVVYAVGRDRPGAEIRPSILVGERAVVCDDEGWWFVVEEGVDPDEVLRLPVAPWR